LPNADGKLVPDLLPRGMSVDVKGFLDFLYNHSLIFLARALSAGSGKRNSTMRVAGRALDRREIIEMLTTGAVFLKHGRAGI